MAECLISGGLSSEPRRFGDSITQVWKQGHPGAVSLMHPSIRLSKLAIHCIHDCIVGFLQNTTHGKENSAHLEFEQNGVLH